MPDEAEVAGLLALMLLTDARRAARTGPRGEIIPLDQQDRALWDRDAIAEGVELISETLPKGRVGPYQLQAAIAAVHDEAASAEETDWPQILALYGVLLRMSDNPMVALNHAIATAMVDGPAAGLERLDELAADPRLAGHHRLDAVRGHCWSARAIARRDRQLPAGGRAHGQHRRAELSADAGGAAATIAVELSRNAESAPTRRVKAPITAPPTQEKPS